MAGANVADLEVAVFHQPPEEQTHRRAQGIDHRVDSGDRRRTDVFLQVFDQIVIDPHRAGRIIGATEAQALGLVNHVVPHADLLATARGIALEIAAKDQLAVRMLLASFHRIAAADSEESAPAIERETA